MSHEPTRLLVTGGAGFIGANFVQYWLGRYPQHRVVVLDALSYAGNRASLQPVAEHAGLSFVQGDILDEELVRDLLRLEDIDTLVHFAAESHVDRSILGPDEFIRTNVTGTHALLKAAREVWGSGATGGRRFHHVSTDEVYGSLGPQDPPFRETTPYAPNSPYAASKAASDHLVRAYHHTYGLDVTTSNCSNNYGPYQFPEKLIPLLLINCLSGKPLPIYGDGLNVRDWLYVEDHCRGIDRVIRGGRSGETYNIGGNCELTNLEVVRSLCATLDRLLPESPHRPHASLIEFVRDRPGHDRRYAIDAARIRTELGFEPRHGFAEGLERTVRWYLEHRAWWQQILDGSYRDWMARQYGTR